MEHGSSTEWGTDHAAAYKSRLGIRLFFFYTLVYFGFVVLNTVSPETMGLPVGGLNLAIVYGFGLILFALLLAFVYNAQCSRAEERLDVGARHIDAWYDKMKAAGKLPKHWDKKHVLTFLNTLNSMEAEVTYDDGRNVQLLDAFRLLFEEGGKK
jgi:uncharacterized membrane protein (DUF485 family)